MSIDTSEEAKAGFLFSTDAVANPSFSIMEEKEINQFFKNLAPDHVYEDDGMEGVTEYVTDLVWDLFEDGSNEPNWDLKTIPGNATARKDAFLPYAFSEEPIMNNDTYHTYWDSSGKKVSKTGEEIYADVFETLNDGTIDWAYYNGSGMYDTVFQMHKNYGVPGFDTDEIENSQQIRAIENWMRVDLMQSAVLSFNRPYTRTYQSIFADAENPLLGGIGNKPHPGWFREHEVIGTDEDGTEIYARNPRRLWGQVYDEDGNPAVDENKNLIVRMPTLEPGVYDDDGNIASETGKRPSDLLFNVKALTDSIVSSVPSIVPPTIKIRQFSLTNEDGTKWRPSNLPASWGTNRDGTVSEVTLPEPTKAGDFYPLDPNKDYDAIIAGYTGDLPVLSHEELIDYHNKAAESMGYDNSMGNWVDNYLKDNPQNPSTPDEWKTSAEKEGIYLPSTEEYLEYTNKASEAMGYDNSMGTGIDDWLKDNPDHPSSPNYKPPTQNNDEVIETTSTEFASEGNV